MEQTELGLIVRSEVIRRGFCWKHKFCSFCGREITKLNLKKGCLIQGLHFLHTLDNGVQIRQCYQKSACLRRRKEIKNEK